MAVTRRRMGPEGPEVPPLSLGSWHTWDRMDFADAVALARRAYDAGIDMFDVGYYNVGPHVEGSHTDVLFGRIIETAGVSRDQYLLCEKLWLWRYPDEPLDQQLDRALFRVGTDRTDLALVGDFFGELDLPKLVTELAELVRAGRVGCWGVNNWAAADLRAALEFATAEGMPRPQFAQLKYSVCRRSIAQGRPYGELFTDFGLGLQASDVLEGGILAGNAEPSRRIGMDTGNIRDAIRAAAGELTRAAAEFDATPARLAVAYCLTDPNTVNVLFGASKAAQFEDNLAAVELAQRHGPAIRERLDGLWCDRDIVAPDAAWGTARDSVPVPPG